MEYKIEIIKSRDEIEQLGTKEKFWFYDENDKKKLFKIGRPGTGEDWAEKVAYELGRLLKLPCATYGFAEWGDKKGTVSLSFVPENVRLVHGNELLAIIHDSNYPKEQRFHLSDYKLSIVLNLIENELGDLQLPLNYVDDYIKKPIDLFVGYLVFDCWIANQDRHHENWAILVDNKEFKLYFAPTYDHGAGLACKVSPEEANKRLKTKDISYSVKKFVTRAKSPFYSDLDKQLKTIEVVELLLEKYPETVCYWIGKIENIKEEDIRTVLNKVPDKFIDNVSKEFAQQILYENKLRLLEIKKGKCNE